MRKARPCRASGAFLLGIGDVLKSRSDRHREASRPEGASRDRGQRRPGRWSCRRGCEALALTAVIGCYHLRASRPCAERAPAPRAAQTSRKLHATANAGGQGCAHVTRRPCLARMIAHRRRKPGAATIIHALNIRHNELSGPMISTLLRRQVKVNHAGPPRTTRSSGSREHSRAKCTRRIVGLTTVLS